MSQTILDITRATTADAPALASVLARAFHDDPVYRWLIRDPDRRCALLPGVFAAFADLYLPHGETYLTSDGAAAAMWAPAYVDAFHGQAGQAFDRRITGLLDTAEAGRCRTVAEVFAEHHPPQPWMYLQLIGVAPRHQGRGLGSRLLAGVLARCDATATPAYLEATSVDNCRLYQRHGFETVHELTLPDDGPLVALMWREPRPRG